LSGELALRSGDDRSVAAGEASDRDGGWSQTEYLVVLTIAVVLFAFAAAPSFVSRGSGVDPVAARNLQQALPAVAAFYAQNGTYFGLDDAALGVRRYDVALGVGVSVNSPVDQSDDHFCLKSVNGPRTVYERGPGGAVTGSKPYGCT
jgi:hypothetical protein